MGFSIADGAIFISDSHENENRHFLLQFLRAVKQGQIGAPQLFLMGDIFDYLSITSHAQEFYEEQISLINEISKSMPCFYFEGNHDFNLSEIFPNLTLFPIQIQPVKFSLGNGQSAQLAHGDKFMPYFSGKVLLTLRSRVFLKFMDFVDNIFANKISKAILNSQKNKNLNRKIENFYDLIKGKIHKYDADFIIEGHYHQDCTLSFPTRTYINLNSFAAERKIYRVRYVDGGFLMVWENLNLN